MIPPHLTISKEEQRLHASPENEKHEGQSSGFMDQETILGPPLDFAQCQYRLRSVSLGGDHGHSQLQVSNEESSAIAPVGVSRRTRGVSISETGASVHGIAASELPSNPFEGRPPRAGNNLTFDGLGQRQMSMTSLWSGSSLSGPSWTLDERRGIDDNGASIFSFGNGDGVTRSLSSPQRSNASSRISSPQTIPARSSDWNASFHKFANVLLRQAAPTEVRNSIDDSLGPFITSIFQGSDDFVHLSEKGNAIDVRSISEYDNVLEVVTEQCSISEEEGRCVLQQMVDVLFSGDIPSFKQQEEEIQQQQLLCQDMMKSLLDDETGESKQSSFNPVRQERVANEAERTTNEAKSNLSADDDLSRFTSKKPAKTENILHVPDSKKILKPVDDNHDENDLLFKGNSKSKGKHKKHNKRKEKGQSKDLAAALFKPSRPRSNSNLSDKPAPATRGVEPLDGANIGAIPGLLPAPHQFSNNYGSFVPSSQARNLGGFEGANVNSSYSQYSPEVEEAAYYLVSSHPISYEAALAASVKCSGNADIAFQLVEDILAAPPVCRHMLQGACYRSDCAFSHEVDGHTCSFWLRGRCGKGPECKFLHGFDDTKVQKLQRQIKTIPAALNGSDERSLTTGNNTTPSAAYANSGIAPLYPHSHQPSADGPFPPHSQFHAVPHPSHTTIYQ